MAQYNRDDFYRQMERISLESIMDHLRLFLPVLLPVVLIRLILPETTEYVFLFLSAFAVFVLANLYLFFFKKVSLHQHDHEHLHEHGHDHIPSEIPEHLPSTGHEHSLPKDMDRPTEPPVSHHHEHEHEHTHLHLHREGETPRHQHSHFPGFWERILDVRNLSALFLLSVILIVFSLTTGIIGVLAFSAGAYLSIYLLGLIYVAGGIRLLEKCISFSDMLSGLIGLMVVFLF